MLTRGGLAEWSALLACMLVSRLLLFW